MIIISSLKTIDSNVSIKTLFVNREYLEKVDNNLIVKNDIDKYTISKNENNKFVIIKD